MRLSSLIALIFSLLLFGCNNTVGTIELKGKVIDENTKATIPNMSIMVEAVDYSDDKSRNSYVGDFTTDSAGCFTYTMTKVRNVSLYNFSILGNPAYDLSSQFLGLSDLAHYGKFLSFEVSRIVDFTMYINRKSISAFRDTLTVSWKTNGIDGKTMYPFKIENYQINSENGLRWVGGHVKAEVKTKVYADKNTIVHWTLYRNGTRREITDTVFCDRNTTNSVYLNY